MTVSLPFTSEPSGNAAERYAFAACTVTVAGVMVLACPDEFFVYNTRNFLATGLKGATNHGAAGRVG